MPQCVAHFWVIEASVFVVLSAGFIVAFFIIHYIRSEFLIVQIQIKRE